MERKKASLRARVNEIALANEKEQVLEKELEGETSARVITKRGEESLGATVKGKKLRQE
jgi:hypothetical protein